MQIIVDLNNPADVAAALQLMQAPAQVSAQVEQPAPQQPAAPAQSEPQQPAAPATPAAYDKQAHVDRIIASARALGTRINEVGALVGQCMTPAGTAATTLSDCSPNQLTWLEQQVAAMAAGTA